MAADIGKDPDEILRSVWRAAVDAVTSKDFRNADGELNEDAYLRYQRNVIAAARAALGLGSGSEHDIDLPWERIG